MEIICVDSKFPLVWIALYSVFGVATPVVDKMYTIRLVTKHTTGEVGILLEEIRNPKMPIKHPILGLQKMEPTWNLKRFRHLDGSEITAEEVNEIVKQLAIETKYAEPIHS